MNDPRIQSQFYRVGTFAAFTQLAVVLAYAVISGTLGGRITTAAEFYQVFQSNSLSALLRVDLIMLLLVGLYLGNYPALFLALWRQNPVTMIFASGLGLIAVIISFTNEASFTLYHLAERYSQSTDGSEKTQLLAAGEAVLASGWWHSTGSYITGILLQGSGVMISIIMLKNAQFHKITAIAGIVGNGGDLIQHLISPFAPALTQYFALAMIAYLLWYPMLGRDLYRLSRIQTEEQ